MSDTREASAKPITAEIVAENPPAGADPSVEELRANLTEKLTELGRRAVQAKDVAKDAVRPAQITAKILTSSGTKIGLGVGIFLLGYMVGRRRR